MKRFLVIVFTSIAIALGTAGTAQARDHHHSSYYGRSYSRSYCAPRYYSSRSYCPPTYYRSYCPPTYYRSYCPPTYYRSYEPRYYSSGYYNPGVRIGLPGIGIFFGR